MENQEQSHLSNTLKQLEKEGYKDQLLFRENQLVNATTKNKYDSDQVATYKEHRFEGMTNPSDMSLLFAIEFKDGSKGTISAAYGPKGDVDLYNFMGRVDNKES
jgi:hypothetical protein